MFGVCLGLQGIVEYFGGSLGQLSEPVHGKPSAIDVQASSLFEGFERKLEVGRYHSLIATDVPECLRVTATTGEGIVMAVEHASLPVSAVQFHPESIMSSRSGKGMRLIHNMLREVARRRKAFAAA